MKFSTFVGRIVAAASLLAIAGPLAAQQAYPSKPIHLIVPYPPGGSVDPVARMAAHQLAEKLGQPVIVENRPGGNTIIGTEAVAKAPPDGYTLLSVPSAFISSASLLPHLPYDTIKDFAAVATIAKARFVLVLHPSVPANTLQELIALAKSKPGQLNYPSSGVGSGPHLSGELLDIMVGIKLQHVPYKGSGALMSDLIGGQVQLAFQAPINVISHIKSGKLRAIAITGETRLEALPQVPTYAEAGLPGYDMKSWFGILAPAGTPKSIIDKISGEMATILIMPDILSYLAKQGLETYISTPEQFNATLRADMVKWARVIKTANIKAEN